MKRGRRSSRKRDVCTCVLSPSILSLTKTKRKKAEAQNERGGHFHMQSVFVFFSSIKMEYK
jgi:hypothetical protein